MKPFYRCACAAVALLTTLGLPAMADPQDYEFQLVEESLPPGQDTSVAVKLIHKPTGKPVSDAVIFATRLDMAPDGMAGMMAELEAVPSAEVGTYRFRTTLGMEGSWRLSIAAKTQGEKETIQSRLILRAKN